MNMDWKIMSASFITMILHQLFLGESGEEPKKLMRKSWHEYFIGIAEMVATRATCPRLSVGAVIVDINNKIVSTGYNGSPSGTPHCTQNGCAIYNGHCIRTIHAEANAILTSKSDLFECTIYCTHEPCVECAKMISQAGISSIYFKKSYHNNDKLSVMPFKDIFEEYFCGVNQVKDDGEIVCIYNSRN